MIRDFTDPANTAVEDYVRFFVFRYWLYFNLMFIFCVGTWYFNVFSFGYLVLSLYVLRKGDLLMDGSHERFMRWLRAYAVVVLFLRLLWQAPGLP